MRRQKFKQSMAETLVGAAEHVCILILDMQSERPVLIDLSPGAETMFGYTRAELLAMSPEELFVPQERYRLARGIKTLRSDRRGYTWDVMLRRHNGEHFQALISVDPIFDDKDRVSYGIGVIIDVTDRKRVEQALSDNQREKTALLETLREAVMYLDPDLKVLWANRAAIDNAAGRDAQNRIRGRYCHEFWCGHDQPCPDCPVLKAHDTGRIAENEIVMSDGRSWMIRGYPVKDGDSQVVGIVATAQDITEQKTARQRQVALSEGMRAIVEIADQLLLCSTLDEVYQCVVEEARNRLGFERCSIYYRDASGIHGTYGTNMQGQTTDERQSRFSCDSDWAPIFRDCWERDSRYDIVESDYEEWNGSQMVVAGHGWIARTPIAQINSEPVAVMFNDTAISGKPADALQQDLLAMLCSFLADVIARKRLESALANSERKYRLMFEQAPYAIVLIDPLTARIVGFNDTTLEMTDYTEEDLRDFHILDKVVGESPASIRSKIRQVQEEGVASFELHVRLKDESIAVVMVTARLVEIDEQPIMQCLWRNITQNRRHEEALLQKSREWENTFNAVPDMIALLDTDARIVRVNRAMALALNMDPADTVGHYCYDLMHEDGIQPEICPLRVTLRDGVQHTIEVFEKKFNGYFEVTTSPIYNEAGKLSGAVHVVRDVTKRREAESRLAESRNFLQAMLDNLPVAVFGKDARDGRYVLWNQSCERLLAMSADDVLGHTDTELLSERQAELFIKSDRAALQGRAVDIPREEVIVPGEGKRMVHTLKQCLMNDRGEPDVILGIAEDITEQVRVQEQIHQYQNSLEALVEERSHELVETNRRLEKEIEKHTRTEQDLKRSREELRALSARLQTIRENQQKLIAREIHDELGATLSGLKMDLARIRKKYAPGSEHAQEVDERFEKVLAEVDETIQQVRRISTQLRPGVLDNVGIVGAIEWQSSEFQSRTGVHCILDLMNEEVDLDFDRKTAVFRIFQEILTNVMRHAQASRVRVQLYQDQGDLILAVRDNGKGFAENRRFGSESLGVLGMRERAHVFGGEVIIHGKPGEGTSVRVRIPITEPFNTGGGVSL